MTILVGGHPKLSTCEGCCPCPPPKKAIIVPVSKLFSLLLSAQIKKEPWITESNYYFFEKPY
jgi:hypothetical protein